MALDNDGYDNILDPNTMESLPKLSGFGSGNLSGSNLYIPVYNSITQEYQKVTVQDVQPDYSGVKNSLLADAITTQAAPAYMVNMVTNPNIITPIAFNHIFLNGVTGYNAAAGVSGTTATGCDLGAIVGILGAYDTWQTCCSAGTMTVRAQGGSTRSSTINFANTARLRSLGDTLCDGMGPFACRPFSDTSSSAQVALWSRIPSWHGQALHEQQVSLSFCVKSSSASKKLWYAIVTDDGGANGAPASHVTSPVTFSATDVDPVANTGYTIRGSGSVTPSSTHVWQRVALENVTIPAGQSVCVVFVENTATNGEKFLWLSGVSLNKGIKAAVYRPDLAGEAQAISMAVQKVTGSAWSGASPQVGCSHLGVWTTTTNFRVHIPTLGRFNSTPSSAGGKTSGFRGTITNVGAVEAATGTFRAASASTLTVMGNGVILNVTTAATTAGLTGWLSMKDTSTYWENNFWYIISRS